MELSLIADIHNKHFPLRAIHIKNPDIASWIEEMQQMNIQLENVSVYTLPGKELNSISGCLVIFECTPDVAGIRRNAYCQQIGSYFFIPQYSKIYPFVSEEEIDKLCSRRYHFLDPELGLCELEEEVNWIDLCQLKNIQPIEQIRPEASVYIPNQISSFRISLVPNEGIQQMLESVVQNPSIDKLKDKPLSNAEKIKYYLYKKILGSTSENNTIDKESKFLKLVDSIQQLMKKDKRTSERWSDSVYQDYENLKDRSQSEMEKLMKLLKDNPEEALNYAIPIDNEGTNRGGELGAFQLNRQQNDFSSLSSLLNRKTGSGGGSYTFEDDIIYQLQNQYRSSAQKLIEEKKYMQASYIYIKLLKDNYGAANMFERAEMYREAGSVYHDLIKNWTKAAECYEKGKMYDEAIELYKENEMYENVGDIYIKLNKRKEANSFYQKVVDKLAQEKQYIKAATISREKMEDLHFCQNLLLEGWKTYADPYNCIGKYFSNIDDTTYRGKEIERIYNEDVNDKNIEGYLQIVKQEYKKQNELSESTKNLAYKIIARVIPNNKLMASELIEFNQHDKQLVKDTIRYKISRKK